MEKSREFLNKKPFIHTTTVGKSLILKVSEHFINMNNLYGDSRSHSGLNYFPRNHFKTLSIALVIFLID